MILDPKLTKAIADLDAAAKRLQRATAPNLCIDCAEPCGYLDQYCALCKAKYRRDEKRLTMLERLSGDTNDDALADMKRLADSAA